MATRKATKEKAREKARQLVKDEMRKQGIKVNHVSAAEISKAVDKMLEEER